ncbi:helix-turn-helix domain-containing protein [Bradyrhizobium sp. AUGA SZCCT0283]|uniref:AlbA family DNA-binding domain-containing protein n=1 Tax=Bradyrhizobium sp. AUGA SZCCT0283 TaxID=2807671 RepID=UPI001BA96C0B|nr:ATP-binding protein [Bradyrhizobium sp. AUGA SZCCT0283]MBR1278667.1 ATP-binding protein [Bradyrhizobium sp. AUGA SZCCT0283]
MTLAENFNQLDWATIESYVVLQQQEHLHLDFKTLKNAELTSSDGRRNIARSISGFANSSGGIIVWGFDARKNAMESTVPLQLLNSKKLTCAFRGSTRQVVMPHLPSSMTFDTNQL